MKNLRFQPYRFRNGRTTKNRVVVPPMASQTADEQGFVTAATLEHYARLSRSGAGIVMVEYSFVHQTGKAEERQLGVSLWEQVDGLAKVAATIQASGALAGLQLVHAGGKTSSALTGQPLMGPSNVSVPVKGVELEASISMSLQQIEHWEHWFLAAAQRAHKAGFDMVELHAAHGYGLSQWLSPLTNQRADCFGKSIKGRSCLLLRMVRRMKEELPELLLAVRLPAQDHLVGGLTVDEMVSVAKQLELAGVDLVDVSSGIGGWRRPEGRDQQGYLVEDAASLKKHLTVPVIGVGGIETGAFVDQILQEQKVDFAAVGRAILRDPLLWGQVNL